MERLAKEKGLDPQTGLPLKKIKLQMLMKRLAVVEMTTYIKRTRGEYYYSPSPYFNENISSVKIKYI